MRCCIHAPSSNLFPRLRFWFFASAACAQNWDTDATGRIFSASIFPPNPASDAPYKRERATQSDAHGVHRGGPLTARRLAAPTRDGGRLHQGEDELMTAVELLEPQFAPKHVKYAVLNNIDLHLSRRFTIETGSHRILAESPWPQPIASTSRGETPLSVPPPAVSSLVANPRTRGHASARARAGRPEGTPQSHRRGRHRQ